MTNSMPNAARPEPCSIGSNLEAIGRELARYGLVIVVGWIGLMKFTTYEAEGIRPFVANSPLMKLGLRAHERPGFLHHAWRDRSRRRDSHRGRARPRRGLPPSGCIGGRGCSSRLWSFLITTPGVWEPSLGGFPGSLGGPRTVPHQGCSLARHFALDVRRILEGERATEMRRRRLVRPSRG